MTTIVEVYQDDDGAFHYQAFIAGTKNARRDTPTLCGITVGGMRQAAWFPVGDPRGRVHHDNACHQCRRQLAV